MATQTTDSYPTTPTFPRAGNSQIFELKRGDCVRTGRRAVPRGDVGRCRVRRLAPSLLCGGRYRQPHAPVVSSRLATTHHHADLSLDPFPTGFRFPDACPSKSHVQRWAQFPMIRTIEDIHKGRASPLYSVDAPLLQPRQTNINGMFLVPVSRWLFHTVDPGSRVVVGWWLISAGRDGGRPPIAAHGLLDYFRLPPARGKRPHLETLLVFLSHCGCILCTSFGGMNVS